MRFQPTYPIETERLLLRPYAESDEDFLLDLFGRDDVLRYLGFPPGAFDRDRARGIIERRVLMQTIDGDGSKLILAAVAKDDPGGAPVAEFMLVVRSARHRQGEVGWVVHPDRQGRGLATEGAARLLRLGFEELGLHRIVAESDRRNGASVRVMERLGMRFEAHLRESELQDGEWIDNVVYAILEPDCRAATAGG
jgi:RimJ/RimL family protein N-acetyltransferase